jgi:hypothetical protein
MGNYSTDPTVALAAAQAQGYVRVRFQQGKPMLDRELNLAADLAASQGLFANYLGNGIAAGTNGFAVSALNPATGDFMIAGGLALVNGLEAVASDTTYRTQPQPANVGPLPAGTSNVYLHVWTQEIGSAQDPSLANPGDVTFETSVRDKILWEVVVSAAAINQPDHLLLAQINAFSVIADKRRPSLNLGAVRDDLTALKGRVDNSLDANGVLKAAQVGITQLKALSSTFNVVLAGSASTFLTIVTTQPLIVNINPTTTNGVVSWALSAGNTAAGFNEQYVRIQNETAATVQLVCNVLQLF